MNPSKYTSRLLGAAFLYVAAASLLSGLLLGSFGIEVVGAPDNISETMFKISDNPTMMQMSIVVMFMEAVGIVLLADLLYTTLKNQNAINARWAFGLWIVEATALVIRGIGAFSLMNVSQEFVKAGAPDTSHFQTLGSILYGTIQISYTALMVFYCVGGILFYYLFFKSRYIPIALSLWGVAAVSLGFIGTLLEVFEYDVPLIVFLPILPFELAIGIWLIVKGFNSSAIVTESVKTGITEIN